MGPGVGLEVANSIYFDMPRGQFAYWNADDRGREMVRELIRSGHIDCLHSFGDLATTRAHAARSLEELSRHGCWMDVWVDHATAPSNFGADIMRGSGDVAGSPAYHADLTLGYGIRYVWRGRVTSIIGQNTRRRVPAVLDPAHPIGSLQTAAKELAKGVLARAGSEKYGMHGPNRVMREAHLRSGQPIVEFLRANPHWRGVSGGDTAAGLAEVLTPKNLRSLAASRGVCVLYTHLGKIVRRDRPFPAATQESLRTLAQFAHEGEILVTTTQRLLRYLHASERVEARLTRLPDVDRLEITTPESAAPRDLQGLTFYVPEPERTELWHDGRALRGICNPPDHTARRSISIPWIPLTFPPVS